MERRPVRKSAFGRIRQVRCCWQMHAKNMGLHLLHSQVTRFNGVTQSPYLESDDAQPLNVYGVSKYLAETHVLSAYPSSIIIRTSSFFGPWDRYNFLVRMVETIERGDKFAATSDFVISPTYLPDLVNACLDLIIDKEQGIWHITNPLAVSWMHFALLTAEIAKFNTDLIRNVKAQNLGYMAPRPGYSALKSEKGLLMPSLDSAIQRFLTERGKE
jgi:dTDP-4-dehydrorhamnose reductase